MIKRNPCTYLIETFDSLGQYLVKQERRGYAQERKTIDGVEMVFVMEGGDSAIGLWIEMKEVTLTKGKWSNKTTRLLVKSLFGEEVSKMKNANELAFYLWKRINQDQILLEKTRPRNTRGLYFNQSDLDSYIRDYFNYGMDWDDTSKEDLWDKRYWDERDIDV